ncbi:MAG: methyl-accepting chemotaxis protein [Hormoscilla sp.]
MQHLQDQELGSQAPLAENTDSAGEELIEKLLQANICEQAGEIGKAISLYEEIVARDGEGTYGLSAQKALESLPSAGGKPPSDRKHQSGLDPGNGKTPPEDRPGDNLEGTEAEVEDLIDKLLQANIWEQSGEIDKAIGLYREIIAIDGEGSYGLSAQKALEGIEGQGSWQQQEAEVAGEKEKIPTQTHENSNSGAAAVEVGDLIEKLLQANSWEQAGEIDKATGLYEEIIALDPEGSYGLSAQKALEALGKPAVSITVPSEQPGEIAPEAGAPSVELQQGQWIKLNPLTRGKGPKGLGKRWGNLGVRTKLSVLLIGAAVLPMVAATVAMVWLGSKNALMAEKEKLKSNLDGWEKEYVLWQRDDSSNDAETLARLVTANGVNLSDSAAVETNKADLLRLLREATTAGDKLRPELTKSFWIFTDAEGRSVAQTAKIQLQPAQNAAGYPLLPGENSKPSAADFEMLSTPVSINMAELPIVKKVLETGEPLRGVELVPWEYLAPLGLSEQTKIRGRTTGETAGETVEVYRTGLTSMAVYPVRVNDRMVGTAIVGVLLNGNYALIDHVGQVYDIPWLSLFAQRWMVNTTVADRESGTRAIGTLAAPAVTEAVIARGSELLQTEQVNGVKYIRMYRPVYDHQQQLNPGSAKPVGMISAARQQPELAQLLAGPQLLGLSIGTIMLVLVLLVGLGVASALARELRSLASFAERLGSGDRGTRLATTGKTDEVGLLALQLNEMASSIESNIDRVSRAEENRRQEVEQQRLAKEKLQRQVIELLMKIEGAQQGNLTVHIPQMEGEVGAIADAVNATIRSLRQLVSKVKTVTSQVTQEASESEVSVGKLSTAALTQSQELTQALVEVVEISDSIDRVAQSSQEAAHLARSVAEAAELGDAAMDKTVVSMDNIRTAVANTAKKAKRLAESSQEISQMVEIISAISEKANLLAFNASIEAARAGSQGQGFREVAEQVRGLAQQVSESTQNIEQLISSIQQETADVLNGMEIGTSEVVTGTQLVSQTKQTLQGLTELSGQIDQYLQDVAANTVAQTEASRSVNERMERVANIAVKTSNEAQSVSSLLAKLVTQVATLQSSVERFQVE